MKTTLAVAASLCAFSLCSATTYYVDASIGNDSYTGQAQTYSAPSSGPWKTVARVNQAQLNAGDQVQFKKGQTFRGDLLAATPRSGQLKVTDTENGSEASPIIFDSYGSGNMPVISGSTLVTGAVLESSTYHRYRRTWGLEPQQVFFTGTPTGGTAVTGMRGHRKQYIWEVTGNYDWCVQNNYLYYSFDGTATAIEATEYKVPNPTTDRVTSKTPDGTSIYYTTWSAKPGFMFFNGQRGRQVASSDASLLVDGDWYSEPTGNGTEVFLHFRDSTGSALVDAPLSDSATAHLMDISGSYVTIRNLQLERCDRAAIVVNVASEHVVLDKLTVLQWSNEENAEVGAVTNSGQATLITGCTFGKATVPPATDVEHQNWAGFVAICSKGSDPEIVGNFIYHSSTENENANGRFATGIRIVTPAADPGETPVNGTVKAYKNRVEHVGAHGIMVGAHSTVNDQFEVYDNVLLKCGQAGISVYQTRGADGVGAIGHVYRNQIDEANRLGGDVGSGYYVDAQQVEHYNGSSGIHFNDGVQAYTDPAKPFIKWYCYDNVIYWSHCPARPANKDSDGIALDFNANGVEVFRNTVHHCDGKGMYIYNADDCRVYDNIVYGNDCGISVTSDGGTEEADNNVVHNNVFYKNDNGSGFGKNLATELYFGKNGDNNIFYNNILWPYYDVTVGARAAYQFIPVNTTGCMVNYNLIYSDAGANSTLFRTNYSPNVIFSSWRTSYPAWDGNSVVYQDPGFTNPGSYDFHIATNSPAVNSGVSAPGFTDDFTLASIGIVGNPDIGRFERESFLFQQNVTFDGGGGAHQRLLNYSNDWHSYAQGFRLPSSARVFALELLGRKRGTTALTGYTVTAHLYRDSGVNTPNLAGQPQGSSSIAADSITTSEQWYRFGYPVPLWVNGNENYYIVLRGTYPLSITDHVTWRFANNDPYVPGTAGLTAFDIKKDPLDLSKEIISVAQLSGVTYDFAFKIYYNY